MVTLAVRSDLEEAYRREGPRLWRALMAYCGNHDVADEAVAEAYAQALRRGEAIRHPERWVWRAAFRIAAGDLQKRRRWVPLEVEGVVHNPEPAWDLIEALAEVPTRQRACLVLHYYAGYSTVDIARIVGSTPPAVRMQLSRGRRRLNHMLGGGDADE